MRAPRSKRRCWNSLDWDSSRPHPLRIADLSSRELARRLNRGNLLIEISPFVARIQTSIESVVAGISQMYAEFSILEEDRFADFHVRVAAPPGLRRWLRPQAFFYFDGRAAFKPLRLAQAYPMLEWGLNWCIAAHAHQFLIMHAAVVERDGWAAILPAPPGAGKSTLCAGLVSRGWRLFSDELALYDMRTRRLQPLSRPLNLKNESIGVIHRFQPAAEMTAPVPHTAKGTVALMAPPAPSVQRLGESAMPAWIVFPRYEAGAPAQFRACSKARAAWMLAEQSFNYDIHGRTGFEALTQMVDGCDCCEFSYGDLEAAVHAFSGMPRPTAPCDSGT